MFLGEKYINIEDKICYNKREKRQLKIPLKLIQEVYPSKSNVCTLFFRGGTFVFYTRKCG